MITEIHIFGLQALHQPNANLFFASHCIPSQPITLFLSVTPAESNVLPHAPSLWAFQKATFRTIQYFLSSSILAEELLDTIQNQKGSYCIVMDALRDEDKHFLMRLQGAAGPNLFLHYPFPGGTESPLILDWL